MKVSGLNNKRLIEQLVVLERAWLMEDIIELELGMEPMFVIYKPRIDATRGCLAIRCDPIIYCLEDVDQEIKGRLLDVEIDKNEALITKWKGDLLNGVMVVEAKGQFFDFEGWRGHLYQPKSLPVKKTTHPARVIAIPYYAWGNWEIGGMRVWIPEKMS